MAAVASEMDFSITHTVHENDNGGIERVMRLCLPLSVISILKEPSLSTDILLARNQCG